MFGEFAEEACQSNIEAAKGVVLLGSVKLQAETYIPNRFALILVQHAINKMKYEI